MSIEEDQKQLEEIEVYVRQWLHEHKAPPTMRNVIRALSMLHYIDKIVEDFNDQFESISESLS